MQRFRHSTTTVLVVLWVLCILSHASSAAPSGDVPLVDQKVRQLMQDRDYAEAVKAIEEASQAEETPKDCLAYLKGRALLLQKQYDEAVEAFRAVEAQFPKSPWARRARFAGALDLAAHDLWGKLRGEPVWRVWGLRSGSTRSR